MHSQGSPRWIRCRLRQKRRTCEPIARLANKQDEATGHFWEGRFKAIGITVEAGLLACSMYVDLNPIRAAMAQTLAESLHTSDDDRIQSLQGATIPSAAADLVAIDTAEAGRQRSTHQKADIPNDLDRILKSIGIDDRMWVNLVWDFMKYFGKCGRDGSPESLKESASQRNRKFARGQKSASECFVVG